MSMNARGGAGWPTVFVSYSHKDREWLDDLRFDEIYEDVAIA